MILDPTSLRLALIFVLSLAVSLALTGLLRRWLLARQILDRPNERSAHTIPVPRGGGLAILAVLLPVWAYVEPGLWPLLLAAAVLGAAGGGGGMGGVGPRPKPIAQGPGGA